VHNYLGVIEFPEEGAIGAVLEAHAQRGEHVVIAPHRVCPIPTQVCPTQTRVCPTPTRVCPTPTWVYPTLTWVCPTPLWQQRLKHKTVAQLKRVHSYLGVIELPEERAVGAVLEAHAQRGEHVVPHLVAQLQVEVGTLLNVGGECVRLAHGRSAVGEQGRSAVGARTRSLSCRGGE